MLTSITASIGLAASGGASPVGLDVGVFGSGALSLVPQVLRRYSTLYPDVQIVLLNVMQSAQVEALRQRRLLITFDRYLPEDQDLIGGNRRPRTPVGRTSEGQSAGQEIGRTVMQTLARERFIVGRTRATPTASPRCARPTASTRASGRRQATW